MSDSIDMDTFINLQRLQYADLLKLGRLAAEAMALSQDYDQSRSRAYCELSRHAMLRCWRAGAKRCVTAARDCELSHAPGPLIQALRSAHRVAVLFVDDALLHDKAHILEHPDVRERIALDRDDIG
jgi:hypothetical protein